MSKISQTILKSAKTLTEAELSGISKISDYIFYMSTSLTTLEIPFNIKSIGIAGFYDCSNLTSIITDNMYPYCLIGDDAFKDTAYIKNKSAGTPIYMAKNKILLSMNEATNYTIPNTVVNLASMSCSSVSSESSMTNFVIPDTVEIVQDRVFSNRSALTKITIGSSVRYIGKKLYTNSSAATLIFRQPSGMNVELPTPGEDTGLAYNKNSRNITIYTDNECIKNYGWSTDNATVTFYPLSQAPQ